MGDVNRDMIEGCLALFKATYSEQLSGLDTQEMDDLYLKGLDKSSFLADKPTYEQMLVQKVTEIKSLVLLHGRSRGNKSFCGFGSLAEFLCIAHVLHLNY